MQHATDSTAGAAAVLKAAGALLVAALGVEPQAIVWALIGATIGLSFAAPSTFRRAALVYVCVVLACALLGTWGAASLFDGAAIARNAIALVVALLFHPILSAAVTQVAGALAAARRRVGLGD